MEQFGLELVVEGLMEFKSGLDTAQGKIDDVAGSSTLLGKVFDSVSDALTSFGREVLNVAEYALGHLLADAIQAVISGIKELLSETIRMGNEFQTLEIRLRNINMAQLTEEGKSFAGAMSDATEMTKQQLDWVIKLSTTTPYSSESIAKVYTMARAYDFADEQAKDITEAVINFTGAMGLSSVEMERIVRNFGQMQQQGRITQRDLNDLARGAFVPVNNILEEIRKKFESTGSASLDFSKDITKLQSKLNNYESDLAVLLQRQSEFGPTTKESVRMANQANIDELKKKISDVSMELLTFQKVMDGSGTITKEMFNDMLREGLPAEEFISGFIDMVNEKFPSAAKDMARTFQGATENLKQFFSELPGAYVVVPILNVIGGKIADVMDALGAKYDEFKTIFMSIGESVGKILSDIFEIGPSADDIAGWVLEKLRGLANWLSDPENQRMIVGWAIELYTWIKDELVPVIRDELVPWIVGSLVPGIARFVGLIWNNKDGILEFFSAVGGLISAIGQILNTQVAPDTRDWVDRMSGQNKETVLDFLRQFVDLIREQIVPWIKDHLIPAVRAMIEWLRDHWSTILPWLERLLIAFLALEIIKTMATWVATLVSTFLGLLAALVSTIAMLISFGMQVITIGAMIVGLISNIMLFKFAIDTLKMAWVTFWNIFSDHVRKLGAGLEEQIDGIERSIRNKDWVALGGWILSGIVTGMWIEFNNFYGTVGLIISTVVDAIYKEGEGFYNFGIHIMEGLADGIRNGGEGVGDALMEVATAAWNRFLAFWEIGSPSKLAQDAARNIMDSFSSTIFDATGQAVAAMQNAAVSISAPLINVPAAAQSSMAGVSNTYNNASTSNYNLNINSNAGNENIISDFNMLSSLAGA